jgi:hypothetical protein
MRAGLRVRVAILQPVVMILLFVMHGSSEAQRTAPAGDEWWCTNMTLGAFEQTSWCSRTEASCDKHREDWLADQSEYSQAEASECSAQVKATVLHFFNVMQDADMYWVHSSMGHCRTLRSYLLRQKGDVSRVSACAVTGPVKPPKPNKARVPKGKGWFCFEFDKPTTDDDEGLVRLGGCARTQEKCEFERAGLLEDVDEANVKAHRECSSKQPAAHVLTSGKDAVAFPTPELCETVRTLFLDRGPSACGVFR